MRPYGQLIRRLIRKKSVLSFFKKAQLNLEEDAFGSLDLSLMGFSSCLVERLPLVIIVASSSTVGLEVAIFFNG